MVTIVVPSLRRLGHFWMADCVGRPSQRGGGSSTRSDARGPSAIHRKFLIGGAKQRTSFRFMQNAHTIQYVVMLQFAIRKAARPTAASRLLPAAFCARAASNLPPAPRPASRPSARDGSDADRAPSAYRQQRVSPSRSSDVSARKSNEGALKKLDDVDAGIARELRNLESPVAVLRHYRENVEDYDTVNLANALQKVVQMNSAVKPWKRDMLPRGEVSQMAAHLASALRDGFKKQSALDKWKKESAELAKDDRRIARELAAAPASAISCRTVANSVYTLSRLGKCPPSLLHEVSHSLAHRVDEMNPADTAQLAFAFSSNNTPAHGLLNALAKRVVSDIDAYEEKELSSLLTSYASLRTAAPTLFAAAVDQLAARREQTKTVTPQVLANVATALAKSIQLDAAMPDRLKEAARAAAAEAAATGQQDAAAAVHTHEEAAVRGLTRLAERIESVARKYRVPVVQPGFTAQGLATTAWAYAQAFCRKQKGDTGRTVDGALPKSAARAIAARAVEKHGGQDAAAAAASVSSLLGHAASPTALSDGLVVRVLTALSTAFKHPQTLATASGVQLAMMARAMADVRVELQRRAAAAEAVAVVAEAEAAASAAAASVRSGVQPAKLVAAAGPARQELERVQALIQQLGSYSTVYAVAQAAVRVLSHQHGTTGAGAPEALAQTGSIIPGSPQRKVSVEADAAEEQAAVLASRAPREPAALKKLVASFGAGEVEEELSAAADMLRDLDEEPRQKAVERGKKGTAQNKKVAVHGAVAPVPAAAAVASTADEQFEEPENAAAATGSRYSPLAHAHRLALITPVSMHDIAELSSAMADVGVVSHEAWAKIADHVERALLRAAADDNAEEGEERNSSASTVASSADISDMTAKDAATLLQAVVSAAPDAHAWRVLRSVALVFLHQDLEGQGVRGFTLRDAMGAVASRQSDKRSAVAALGGGLKLLDADRDSNGAAVSKEADKLASTVMPSFDEEPTWSDDEREAQRRAATFRKPGVVPAFRLRGQLVDGSLVPTHSSGDAGEEDSAEAVRVAAGDVPRLYQGTRTSWAAKLLHRASFHTQCELAQALASAFPAVSVLAPTGVIEEATSRLAALTDAAGSDGANRDALQQLSSADALSDALLLWRQAVGLEAATHAAVRPAWHMPCGALQQHSADIPPEVRDTLLKRSRDSAGLSALGNAGSSSGSSSGGALANRIGAVGSAGLLHMLALLSERIATRAEEEGDWTQQVQLLQLLLTRDYTVPHRAVADLVRRADASDAAAAEHASRRALQPRGRNPPAGASVSWLRHMHVRSPHEAAVRRIARQAEEALATAQEKNSGTRAADSGQQPQQPNAALRPSRLHLPLSVYTPLSAAFGLALSDSLQRSRRGLTGSLHSDRHLHGALMLAMDEASRRYAAMSSHVNGKGAALDSARLEQVTALALTVGAATAPLLLAAGPHRADGTRQEARRARTDDVSAQQVDMTTRAVRGFLRALVSDPATQTVLSRLAGRGTGPANARAGASPHDAAASPLVPAALVAVTAARWSGAAT